MNTQLSREGMRMGCVYDDLGVPIVINAAGTATRLGGPPLSKAVTEAMAKAGEASVYIEDLQYQAAQLIREVTGAESGLVTSGASAGLTLAAAACMARLDVAKMRQLPDSRGIPNEILIARSHRNAYDRALTLAGAKLIDVGIDDWAAGAGVRGIEPEIFAESITDRTVAIFYLARPEERISLRALVSVARQFDLPVIVDAAAQLPPRENLRRFIDDGADLVVFSGGKAIGGPQGTGILCGKKELVASAALQMVDLDVPWEAWNPPRLLFPKEALRGMPYHGIGRGFKVSKEEIVGLMVALRQFIEAEETQAQMVERIRCLAGQVAGLPGVDQARLVLDAPTPLLQIKLDEASLKRSPWEISTSLRYGTPRIAFNEQLLHQGILIVNPISLRPGDEDLVVQGLVKELTRSLR